VNGDPKHGRQFGLFGPTLADLRAEVDAHLKPGMPPIECRVCGQHVQLYRRKINSGMARALVRLYLHNRQNPGMWMDYRDRSAQGESRNHPYLRFWGLIERGPEAGFWRITDYGRDFVEDRVTVPRAVWHFNNTAYGFTAEQTTIRRALGDHFDLDELLFGSATL
jgi:hypothetical protein